MKPLCSLALVLWFLPQVATAKVPFGQVVATFPYYASKALADPVRPRVYLTDLDSNSVIAIDTVTLNVLGSLPTGTKPVDMAITLDGSRLYVVNGGSTSEAIDLIDLDTFTETNSFSLPYAPASIAAGQGGRLYVGTKEPSAPLYQLDDATGAVQAIVPDTPSTADLLRLTPDGNTLFVSYFQPYTVASVSKFDVSTANARRVQYKEFPDPTYRIIQELVVGYTGVYLCVDGILDSTFENHLVHTANLNSTYKALPKSVNRVAFSPDDRFIYSEELSRGIVGVYNTRTAELLHEAQFPPAIDPPPIPNHPAPGGVGFTDSMTVDNTGSYIFYCQSGQTNAYLTIRSGRVSIIGTGGGTGLPKEAPVVYLAPLREHVAAGSNATGAFTLTRTGNLARPLTVTYSISGTAQNGTDYQLLSGTKRFAAGKDRVNIQIVPAADIGTQAKTVTLTLEPGTNYQRVYAFEGTVTIRPGAASQN